MCVVLVEGRKRVCSVHVYAHVSMSECENDEKINGRQLFFLNLYD